MTYFPSHVHLERGSQLDGAIKAYELMQRLYELNIESAACTDHGSLASVPSFYRSAREVGIRPAIGLEAYQVPDRFEKDDSNYHLILIAKNETGYRNLLQLCSESYKTGMYYKPRIDYNLLEKHNEGLICTTACLGSEFNQRLVNDDIDGAVKVLGNLKNIFGHDLYVEIQNHGMEDQQKVLNRQIELADMFDLKAICSGDSHYLHKHDAGMHRVLMSVGLKKSLKEFMADDHYWEVFTCHEESYIKSAEEMLESFKGYEYSVVNTLEIAEKCKDFKITEFETNQFIFPSVEVPKGKTNREHVAELCAKRLSELRIEDEFVRLNFQEYQERVSYEIGIIDQMGFLDYFVLLYDELKWCLENDIEVGPGRGSAAGSLVAYLLRIVMIDPIKYHLIFERFLNPHRVSFPDADIDISSVDRARFLHHLKEKYGEENVAHIGTFQEIGVKSGFKDVGRVLEVNFDKINDLTSKLPNDIEIEDAEEMKEITEDEEFRVILSYVKHMQGISRNPSVHASGILISPIPINYYIPTRIVDGVMVSQYTMEEVEKDAKLVKIDFLGLKTLSIYKYAKQLIFRKYGIKLDLYKIPLDDPKVYAEFSKGNTTAIFQFESDGMKALLRSMNPSNLDALSIANAMYRPGPLDAKVDGNKTMVDIYVERVNGLAPITYDHPLLEKILVDTAGVFCFQEQIMFASVALAGYSLAESDELRSVVSKKKKEKIAEQKIKFINGCLKNPAFLEHGDEALAHHIWSQIETFGRYGFNRSHSTAYAYLAYICMYLKVYYPHEYMCAALSVYSDDKETLPDYMAETKKMGISIVNPSVNISSHLFGLEDDVIRYPLSAIKGLGGSSVESIVGARDKDGNFMDFVDFVSRVEGVSTNQMKAIAHVGGFDSFGYNRATSVQAVDELSELYKKIKTKVKNNAKRKKPLDDVGAFYEPLYNYEIVDLSEYSVRDILKTEHELTGSYLSGHPVQFIRRVLDKKSTIFSNQIHLLPEERNVIIGGMVRNLKVIQTKHGDMALFEVEDEHGAIGVTAFAHIYKKFSKLIKDGALVFVKGKVDHYRGNAKVQMYMANEIPFNDEMPRDEEGNYLLRNEGKKSNKKVMFAVEKRIPTYRLCILSDTENPDLLQSLELHVLTKISASRFRSPLLTHEVIVIDPFTGNEIPCGYGCFDERTMQDLYEINNVSNVWEEQR